MLATTAPLPLPSNDERSTSGDGTGPLLSADQLTTLRRDGFLRVDGLSTPDEIALIRDMYDRLFTEGRGWEKGDLFDMVGNDRDQAALALPQMLWPSRYEPRLRQTRLANSAENIAKQILGGQPENYLEHAILKPAFHGAATPWHQDDAFGRKGSGFVESISIWMALQDTTVEGGCMQYIAGSNHEPLYPHRSPGNDPSVHGLELVTPPGLTRCVAVPIPAGSAIIHLSRTIHGAGPNNTAQPRRAYVLGYAVKGRDHQIMSRDYAWNLEKQTAREKREMQSLPPFRRTLRRIRHFIRGGRF